MALLSDPEYIYKFISDNPDYKFWKVTAQSSVLGEYIDEGGTASISIERLKNLFSYLRGTVELSLRNRKLEAGGDVKTGKLNYKIDLGINQQPTNQPPVGNMQTGFPTQYDLMLQNFELKMELMTLKLKDSSDNKSSIEKTMIFNRLMNIIDPSDEKPISGYTPKPASGEPANEKGKILMDALNVLKENDPDFYLNIAKLAKLKTDKPETYIMAIETLKSM